MSRSEGCITVGTIPDYIIKPGIEFWVSKTLPLAVEFGMFGALAKAPADLPTSLIKLGLHRRSARDFFSALVALKLLERQDGIHRNRTEAHASSRSALR